MGIIDKEKDRAQFKQDLIDLIAAAKGRPSLKEGLWFYDTFLPDRIRTASLTHEALQNAWWIEEEDIKQFLLAHIWENKLSTIITNLRHILAYPLRDWLCKQGPFDWKSKWVNYITDIQYFSDPEIEQVLETKDNLYNSYFKYLKYGLEMDYRDMVPILLRDRWTISDDDRLIQQKYIKQEKNNGRRVY
jgi:hypothetical protein